MKRFLVYGLFFPAVAWSGLAVKGDKTTLPGQGFDSSHYGPLWIKSPFAVASAEPVQESVAYALVGVAEFDGVSYVSLIDKQSKEHFLISSNKPDRGLTLISVTRGHGPADTMAVIEKGGQSISLKLDQSPMMNNTPPGVQQMAGDNPNGEQTDPNADPNVDPNAGRVPPPVRIRPRIIRIPPNPAQATSTE